MRNYEDKKRFIKTVPHTIEDDIAKPKVLFACINAPNYSPAGMIDGWRYLGYDVVAFDWQHIRYEIGIEDMQDRLIGKTLTEEPEIIFLHVQNKDAVDVEVAKILSQHAFVVNFTEDCRDNIDWYKELAPHIGLTVFTNQEDVDAIKSEGHDAMYMPTSYNHLLYKPQQKTEKDYGEIVFLGNKYSNTNLNFPKAQERQDMIDFMSKNFQRRFRAYGLGQANRMLKMTEAVEAYNNCSIAITHNNFYRAGYFSDRMFNSMGSGCFTLAQNFPDHQKLNLMPFAKWSSFDNLGSLCEFYLSHERIRKEIAHQNFEQVIENHQWRNRFENIAQYIKSKTSAA